MKPILILAFATSILLLSCGKKAETDKDPFFTGQYFRGDIQIGKNAAFNYQDNRLSITLQFLEIDTATSSIYYQQKLRYSIGGVEKNTGFLFSKKFTNTDTITDEAVKTMYHTGTYPFTRDSLKQDGIAITYISVTDPLVFWTSELGDQTGSTFTINKITPLNNEERENQYSISGTFNCKMYSKSSSDTLVIKNGTFVALAAQKRSIYK